MIKIRENDALRFSAISPGTPIKFLTTCWKNYNEMVYMISQILSIVNHRTLDEIFSPY